MAPSTAQPTRARSLLVGAFVLWFAVLAWVALAPSTPRVVGLYHDDGLYWLLGRGLVEQGVYRDLHAPDPLQVARYPPGVPLITAAGQAVAADFDTQLLLVRAVLVLLLASAVLGVWHLLGRISSLDWPERALLTAAVALNPYLFSLTLTPMSEVPAYAVSIAALLVLLRSRERDAASDGALLAFLCGLAIAFRTAGIVLAATVGLVLLFRRRRRAVVTFTVLFVPMFLALALFMRARSQPAPGFEDIQTYSATYDRFYGDIVRNFPDRHAISALQAGAFSVDALFPVFLSYRPDGRGLPLWLLGGFLAVAALLAAVTLARRLKRPEADAPTRLEPRLYLALSFALIVLWPFQSGRFVAILAPLILLEAALGVRDLLGTRGVRVFLAATLATALWATGAHRIAQSDRHFALHANPLRTEPSLTALRKMAAMIPKEALVASVQDSLLATMFGVRGTFAWQIDDFVMGREKFPMSAESLYFGPSDWVAYVRATFQQGYKSVLSDYRRIGITHVVMLGEFGNRIHDPAVKSLLAYLEKSGRARQIFSGGDDNVQLWEIDP